MKQLSLIICATFIVFGCNKDSFKMGDSNEELLLGNINITEENTRNLESIGMDLYVMKTLKKSDFEPYKENRIRTLIEESMGDQEIKNLALSGFDGATVRKFQTKNIVTGVEYIEYEIDGDGYIKEDQVLTSVMYEK